ncbi:MAG: rod shape-determining protein MreC [Crocinitomicaceae bacterium]|nr:rod shape-determining protein MreC [Flavobacteriales bacterium]NQZ36325.1 rod shape-determining protein MreC [Crocinitomicaceae bacterium]
MRNFLAFIRRFRVLLFFALLQGFALTVYFTFSSFPRTQYLTTASSVSGAVMDMRNDVTKHFALSGSNKKLQAENRWLREQLLANRMALKAPVGMDSVVLKKEDFIQRFEYIPGGIISSSFSRRNNYFTLNIGSKQGVKHGMGVISDKGVVGVIHNVSEYFSVVKSCLTENINVDIMINDSGESGFLKWNGTDPRRGNMIGVSNDRSIKKWAKIVTGGKSGIFPRGIPVGMVEKTLPVEGLPIWDVTVLFAENYRTVQYVYVIKNILKTEQELLEESIPDDPIEDE